MSEERGRSMREGAHTQSHFCRYPLRLHRRLQACTLGRQERRVNHPGRNDTHASTVKARVKVPMPVPVPAD